MENLYADLAGDPDYVCGLMHIITETKMRCWGIAPPLVGERAVVRVEADDMASQDCTVISPETYRRLAKPRHKRLPDHVHKLAAAG